MPSKAKTPTAKARRDVKACLKAHIDRAKKALIFYKGEPKFFEEDPIAAVTDLLADLQHFCVDAEIDFAATVDGSSIFSFIFFPQKKIFFF